jgi:uncharacterized protein (DUF433 family)
MSTAVEEARQLVTKLSPEERRSLVEWLAHEPVEVAPGIYRTPRVCGGDACIRGLRLPVWQLEEGRRNGATDEQLLQAHPALTAEDLVNAWAFVAERRPEIDSLIRENNEV